METKVRLTTKITNNTMPVTKEDIDHAYLCIKNIVKKTPLEYSDRLSKRLNAEIYIKREDLQAVRSYKIRGAYNLISSLTDEEKSRGVVCASAGNHAQGFAYSCSLLGIKGTVFMPEVAPKQKISKVRSFGGEWVEVKLTGTTFDEASTAAKQYCTEQNMVFVHPFDDVRTIAGQGTVGLEIMEQLPSVDVIVAPIGGGGLLAGISTYSKSVSPAIVLYGVDPAGAPKMIEAIKNQGPVLLPAIDTFVDGCAVKRAGDITYTIISNLVDKIVTSDEGKVCTAMIELYQNEGIVAEPAGALSVSALDQIKDEIQGKTVVCILSGGNNDILRYPEVMERSLVYEGLKHYFLVEFAQKPGQLKKFLEKVLGPNDDIVRFEYLKKTNKEFGAALVGIELLYKADYEPLLARMKAEGIKCRTVQNDEMLYEYLV
jgi:threonine dehydratase